MNRFEEAEIVLNEALALDPNQELGNIALGLVKMQKGDFEQSRKLLQKAITGDSKSYFAYYYHALVLSRSTVSGRGIINPYDSNTVSVMRSDLKKSIALNPEFAAAYYLYALISIVQNDEIENGLAMLEIGIKLRPEDQMFQLRKSELLMRKKDLINSRLIAEEVQKKAEEDSVREFASNLLENITNYENRIKISDQITEANRYLPKDYEKLTAEQLAALERRIEIDSINKNLREIKEGEKRVLGRVLDVNCSTKGVIFSIRTQENDLRFVNKSFQNLVFYTYQIQLKGGSIGCESNLSKYLSVITFKSTDSSNREFDGELISIEFVPEYFEFRQNAVSDQ
jgi:tetratricopeptide (TPR) repeat protein